MIKRPSFFFYPGDCCGASPAVPQNCVTNIINDGYYSLGEIPAGNILSVAPGTNPQKFLKPAAVDGAKPAAMLMWSPGTGQWVCTITPTMVLPQLNVPASGSTPSFGGSFPRLMVAGPGGEWQFLGAPTNGRFILESYNGGFVLVDAGQIPGINEIAEDATFAAKGNLLAVVIEDDEAVTKKLSVIHQRVVVGDVDGDGVTGYKPLGVDEALTHPLADFTTLRVRNIVAVDADGDPIPDGLEQLVTTGPGSITDALRVVYSPSAQRYFFAPAATIQSAIVGANTGLVTIPTSYGLIPSGHGQLTAAMFNYPKVRIDFKGGLSAPAASNTQSFAIFRDGAQIVEFDNDNLLSVGFSYVDTVSLGNHTYDVRWKRTSGTDQAAMRNSNMLLHSLIE